jgi:hypothetical protein
MSEGSLGGGMRWLFEELQTDNTVECRTTVCAPHAKRNTPDPEAAKINEMFTEAGIDAIVVPVGSGIRFPYGGSAACEPDYGMYERRFKRLRAEQAECKPIVDRWANVQEDVKEKVISFNEHVVPLVDAVLGDMLIAHRRQALYAARDVWGLLGQGRDGVDVSRMNHNLGYGDVANIVGLEPRSRNRSVGHSDRSVASQEALGLVRGAPATTSPPPRRIQQAVDAAEAAAQLAQQNAMGTDAGRLAMQRRNMAAHAKLVMVESCPDSSAAAAGHRVCHCVQRHMHAVERFAVNFDGAVGTAIALRGMNRETRHELHRLAAKLNKALLHESSVDKSELRVVIAGSAATSDASTPVGGVAHAACAPAEQEVARNKESGKVHELNGHPAAAALSGVMGDSARSAIDVDALDRPIVIDVEAEDDAENDRILRGLGLVPTA